MTRILLLALLVFVGCKKIAAPTPPAPSPPVAGVYEFHRRDERRGDFDATIDLRSDGSSLITTETYFRQFRRPTVYAKGQWTSDGTNVVIVGRRGSDRLRIEGLDLIEPGGGRYVRVR